MPELSLEEVEHVALLSRLELTPEEKRKLRHDLSVVLEHFGSLRALDTTGVAPMKHAIPMSNVLRTDATRPSLPREDLLREAPQARDEFFVVPRIVET